MAAPEPYVPLLCRSSFSFLEGASHPEELVEQCADYGLDALALTDRDGVHGVPRAHARARELGVELLIGSEVTLEGRAHEPPESVTLLAQDREGYGNLCRLISAGRLRSPKGQSAVTRDELAAFAPGLLALWGHGSRSFGLAAALRAAFGDRLYAAVVRVRSERDGERERTVRDAARRLGVPVVAASSVLYHDRARRPLQDVLQCIRHGTALDRAGTRILDNAEYYLRSRAAFGALFADDPEAVARTREVAARCAFSLAELRYRYPSERLPDGSTSAQWLRELTYRGARSRYGADLPPAVRRQLDKELSLIEELDYPGYFLTMHEIVGYCREHGILCQGRGSAANSAVCYCLGITAVDPVRMDLLFERFLSRERAEPPDIDLDIEHARREEVIAHVYAKYGRRHAAMVANVVRYRLRSAIRDVGKALGMPETALDRFAKIAGRHEGDVSALLEHAGLDLTAPVQRHFVALVAQIQGFPRHLSIHPGGFLLGHEPVDAVVPIENATMPGRTVIQWDKDDLETLGLFKVDLLALGSLTMLHRAFDLLRAHRGVALEMATIPAEDPATYAMVSAADTVGVFQIESRAQMAMLPRLRPKTFYDLVIEISIVRPGPIAGDMVHPYLRRRNGEEPVAYPHPSLEPVLHKTLGVPLFQEQVIRLAMVAADYTPGEADQLRRDMAAWRKQGKIERHRERLVQRMRAKGIAAEFAERVFEQIRGFGEYGFPESHAASFALIAYATAWLKRHHPDVFACALLDAQPMGFYSPATIVEDAKRHGVEVRPIDVLHSAADGSLERDGERLALRMGLRYVKGLSAAGIERIVAARAERAFENVHDLARRTRLNRAELRALASAGALAGLTGERRVALWEVLACADEPMASLPRARDDDPGLRALDAFETVAWDYRSSGHSPRGHPLAALRAELRSRGMLCAREIAALPHGRGVRHAGMVICRQRPGTANGVVFLTLEDETGFVNVVIWDRVFARFAVLVKTAPFLGVAGRVQRQDGVVHVVARRFFVPVVEEQPAGGGSRDFH